MIRRINKLLSIIIVVGLALYIVLLNKETISLQLGRQWSITTNGGVIYIGVFLSGVVIATLFGLFFGIKAYFRERRYKSQERARKDFYDGMLYARSLLASHNWKEAKDQWNKLIKRDPSNIISRVELSKSLEGSGDIKEALQILDSARAADPNNVEVLFRAAELNLARGNKTAAIDNLALILYHLPGARAAEMARDLSEELGRIEDAIEYQGTLNSLDYDAEAAKIASARLELKRLCKEFDEDSAELKKRLKSFTKKHHDFAPGLAKLAVLEEETGNINSAAELLIRAARASGATPYWEKAIRLWIDHNMPDRALAAARAAAKDTEGYERLRSELNLIRLYLELAMLEEAVTCIDQFPELAKSQSVLITEEIEQELLALKALSLSSRGEHQAARETLTELAQLRSLLTAEEEQAIAVGEAPAPRLSTP